MSVRGRKKDEIPEQLIKRPLGLNKNPFHLQAESIGMSKQCVGGTENLKRQRSAKKIDIASYVNATKIGELQKQQGKNLSCILKAP